MKKTRHCRKCSKTVYRFYENERTEFCHPCHKTSLLDKGTDMMTGGFIIVLISTITSYLSSFVSTTAPVKVFTILTGLGLFCLLAGAFFFIMRLGQLAD